MSDTGRKDVSLKNRVLAGLIAGGLMLAASGATQAADLDDGARGSVGAIALGRKPSIIKIDDAPTTLGSKLGIGSGSNRGAGTGAV
jgi:hypothetical protein